MRRATVFAGALIMAAAVAASAQDADVKVAGRDVPVPKRTKFVAPIFPPEAQARGERGIVVVELLINEQGKVTSAAITRSVPAFDEAALTAVRQWEYEVTKVDGRPVQVRLPVPITFALKLPEVTREPGAPELRQGAAPGYPQGGQGPAQVRVDVTLHADGSVAEAGILSGESPFTEAVLQALRTWRFVVDSEAPPVVFEVTVDFRPGPPPRVDLKVGKPRTVEVAEATPTPAEPAATPTPEASPSPEPSASPSTPPSPSTSPSPFPSPFPSPSPAVAPSPSPSPAPSPAVPPSPSSSPAVSPSPSPSPAVASSSPSPADAPSPGVSPSPGTSPTPPPVEVISLGPAPSPSPTAPPTVPADFQGVSTVRDIVLAPGVPDLAKGRRPVSPPLARLQGVNGTVQVTFSVDAAGSTLVQNVNGPDLLKEAARQAVSSWGFRRTTAERLYLLAAFQYDGDKASAEVRRNE